MCPAGVDEDTIITLMVQRSNDQRQKIKEIGRASGRERG